MMVTNMQKLKYTVWNTLTNIGTHFSVNLIVACSFALGMLLPMLCMGNINVFVENVSTMRLKNDANTWIAYFEDKDLLAEDVISLLQESALGSSDYAVSAYKKGVIEIHGKKKTAFISYLSERWTGFENCKILEGSLNLFDNKNVCLVEESLADEDSRLNVGEEIVIFGLNYTVGGIFSSFNYYGKVLLPLHTGERVEATDCVASNLYFRSQDVLSDTNVTDMLKNIGLTVSEVRSGVEVYRNNLSDGVQRSLGILSVGLVAFAFAAVNITLVLVGKLKLNKRTYGICLAFGSEYSFIFLSAMIENLCCFCTAYLFDIVLLRILEPTYPKDLTLILNKKVYIVAFLFGMIMTASVTWCALRELKEQKLVELFERVS